MKIASNSQEIDNLKTKTLLMFSASWCGPCKVLKPELEKLKLSFDNKDIDMLYVDVDGEFEIVDELDVCQIPTIYLHNPSCINISNKICSSNIDDVTKFLLKNEIVIEKKVVEKEKVLPKLEFGEDGF